jgi:hypothetical protein
VALDHRLLHRVQRVAGATAFTSSTVNSALPSSVGRNWMQALTLRRLRPAHARPRAVEHVRSAAARRWKKHHGAGTAVAFVAAFLGAGAARVSRSQSSTAARDGDPASDYLDPLFLPELVARLAAAGAPCPARAAAAVRRLRLPAPAGPQGAVDLAIGNWLEPPGELHLGRLMSDEVVCLVARTTRPRASARAWTAERYLECEHVAPTPLHAGARRVIDEHLAGAGRATRHRGAQRALRADPADGGTEPAGADHRPPVLLALVDSGLPVASCRCPVPSRP